MRHYRSSGISASLALAAMHLAASLAIAGAARAASANDAAAAFEQLAGHHNLISLGDARLINYGDTEGGLAIGGNLIISGGVIAAHPEKTGQPGSFATLYAKGAVTANGLVMLQSGHAALPGIGSGNQWNAGAQILRHGNTQILSQVNSPDPQKTVDPRAPALDPAWDFAALGTQFRALSSAFAAAPATGAVSVIGQNLTFSADPAITHGAIVFNLDASLLIGNRYNGALISNIVIDVPASTLFVINVLNASGRTLFGGGVNFNYDDSYSQLLWNFTGAPGGTPDTQTVTLGNGGQFYGSVLAPDFLVKNGLNTALNGQIVAGKFDYSGAELHFTGFDIPAGFDTPPGFEELPPTPEPSTYGMIGAGVLLSLAGWKRWRRRAAPAQI